MARHAQNIPSGPVSAGSVLSGDRQPKARSLTVDQQKTDATRYMTTYPSSLSFLSIRRAHVLLFLTIALAFLYLRTFVLPWTPLMPHDDQVWYFQHANRILQGQVPFRDFFVIVMPGTDLLYAAAFKLLGVHLWLAQTFVIVLGFSAGPVPGW